MKRQLLGVAATAALALGFAATAQIDAAQAASAKTLVYCSEGSPEGFNPQFFDNGTTIDTTHQIFNRLVQFAPGSVNISPTLAEKWEISDDGTEYTFHLRHDVKWQTTKNFKPTRGMNADDVVFSFERQWKKDNPFHAIGGGTYAYWENLGMGDLISDVQKVDDYTVKIKLKSRQVAFLQMIAMDWAAIESKEYADNMLKAGTPDKIDQEPVGTGPFILVDYKKDAQIRYKANPDYFGGKQKIENLVFSIVKDATVRKAKLEAGECDVAYSPSPVDLPAIKANPKLEVLSGAGMNVGYLAFNTTKKPFDDKRVRQALSMAIDREAILKNVFHGNGQLASSPLPASLWGHDKSVMAYEYNPEKAKALLKEAGVTDLSTDLWYQPVTRPYNPDGKKMGELMQADLAKIGVKVNLVTFEWGEYRKRAGQGEHTMMQMGWIADYPDPDDFLLPLLTCTAKQGNSNFAQWCNKDFDDLITKAEQTTDQKERENYYSQAQKIFHEEAPWMTTAYANFNVALKKSVTGYKLDPFLALQSFDGVGKSE